MLGRGRVSGRGGLGGEEGKLNVYNLIKNKKYKKC